MNTHASKLIFFLATLVALGSLASAARPLSRGDELAARLKLTGESYSYGCWESLVELQACTGEVLVFFLDGETHLGPGCCRAIHVISRQCWPAMFASLGFTTHEIDLLQGFCDSEDKVSPPLQAPIPSLSPSPSPSTTPALPHA